MLSLSLALTLSCSCVFFINRTDECPHHWNRRGGEAYSDTAPVNPMKSLPDKLACFLEIDHIESLRSNMVRRTGPPVLLNIIFV